MSGFSLNGIVNGDNEGLHSYVISTSDRPCPNCRKNKWLLFDQYIASDQYIESKVWTPKYFGTPLVDLTNNQISIIRGAGAYLYTLDVCINCGLTVS